MRKRIALLLVLAMVLSFPACGEKKEENGHSLKDAVGSVEKDLKSDRETPAERPAEGPFLEETIMLDNEECSIRFTGVEINEFGEFLLKACLENKSSRATYTFLITDGTVNGVSASPLFAVDVAPGEKLQKEIFFWSPRLEENGITRFTDIGIAFRVSDSSNYMADPVAEPSMHLYPYGEDQAERFVREPQPGDIVLLDTPDVTVIANGVTRDNIWGQTVNLYIENRTDLFLMVSADEAVVNGIEANPIFACEIGPDSCGFTGVSWTNEVLEEKGIQDLEEIEMELRIYDSRDWSAPDFFREVVTFRP